MNSPDIPRADQPPPQPKPRGLPFPSLTSPGRQGFVGRRGFLAVLGAGAVTLGVTLLGWIPLARPAKAEPGTEFPGCGRYGDGRPGGPICMGAPYSADYCGEDDWFITGCFDRSGGNVCYRPARICRIISDDGERRDAWRWETDGITYRCADGYEYWNGSPNPEIVICSARLTAEPSPPPSSAPPSSVPPPSPTSSSPFLPALPVSPALPLLPPQ